VQLPLWTNNVATLDSTIRTDEFRERVESIQVIFEDDRCVLSQANPENRGELTMLRHALLLHITAASMTLGYVANNGTSCYVYLDTPSILQAFDLCGTNGCIILTKSTLYIDQMMNMMNLLNCDISIYGEMIWSTNVPIGSPIPTRSSMLICRPRGLLAGRK
jgi:hypothetical protein